MSPWRSVVSRPAWASGVREPAAKRRRARLRAVLERAVHAGHRDLAGRARPEPARVDQHVHQPRAPAQRLAAGRDHLAEHRHELALVVLDRDLDLRADQVVAAEQLGELRLDLRHGEAEDRHLAQQRQRDGAAGLHGGRAREVVVAEHHHLQHVARHRRGTRARPAPARPTAAHGRLGRGAAAAAGGRGGRRLRAGGGRRGERQQGGEHGPHHRAGRPQEADADLDGQRLRGHVERVDVGVASLPPVVRAHPGAAARATGRGRPHRPTWCRGAESPYRQRASDSRSNGTPRPAAGRRTGVPGRSSSTPPPFDT